MKCLYVIISAFFFATHILNAQDGVLDPNFGTNGTTTLNLFDNSSYIYSIVKSDNKIYASGYTHPATRDVFSIVRLNADGELDTDFGNGGVVTPVDGTGYGVAQKILLQPDGKLVAAGWVRTGNKDLYTLVRINEDGTLDQSFGDGGISQGSFSNSTYAEDEIFDAELLSDGRIIVTGRSYNGQNDDGFIGCIDANGDLCTNFGEEGVHIIVFEGGTSHSETARALAVDDNDNIYLAGSYTVDLFDDNTVYIKKLNSLGEFDETFGTDGNVFWSTPESYVTVMEIDEKGRLLIGGEAENVALDNDDFFLTRYSLTGQLDTGFGDNGVVMLDNNDSERVFDIATLPDGNILAAGTGDFPGKFHLARIKENGDLDMTFGTQGWATTLLLSHFNGIQDIHVNLDGSILAGGYAYNGTVWRMALAQYTNSLTAVEAVLPADNFILFPNPAVSDATLSFTTTRPANFSVRLMDMDGKGLGYILTERDLPIGEHIFPISLHGLIPGNYLIIMNFDGVDFAKQIFVSAMKK